MIVPSLVLKQLYTFGSLANADDGVIFMLKNRLSDAVLRDIYSIEIGNVDVPLNRVTVHPDDADSYSAESLNDREEGMPFPLKQSLKIHCDISPLPKGKHTIIVRFRAKPFGKLKLKVDGVISDRRENVLKVPRDNKDDYSEAAIKTRQDFVKEQTGKEIHHIGHYSFDPHITHGNCEHFIGVAQVPMGIAGPLNIHGEHAKGEYFIPMATAEGTLVASYNRGMKLLNLSGGVKCTIQDDAMQRAPVFIFEDARGARNFVEWVQSNLSKIAEEAEATTSVGKLKYIDPYTASKFAYLRFNFTTGDAAGQNMVGRATFAACSWILDNYHDHRIAHFYLESNLATDKKASQVNVMHTRGKRVTAEATIPREVLIEVMRVTPEMLTYHGQVANVGAILSGANNNGLHSANGITAIFIATGQDVANVSESSAGILHTELTPEKDLYISITIPSLIVATYGGGTGLATQRESLEILGCYGRDGVRKFTEIVAGVVLAGELSLGAAISSSDWVSSHEQYGRNR